MTLLAAIHVPEKYSSYPAFIDKLMILAGGRKGRRIIQPAVG
jgi:hypothetical protein